MVARRQVGRNTAVNSDADWCSRSGYSDGAGIFLQPQELLPCRGLTMRRTRSHPITAAITDTRTKALDGIAGADIALSDTAGILTVLNAGQRQEFA
ncbi:MAG: hypothetical protein Ta2A_11450 [Treponemataceae bacterium]|nr:MAG: hypothetical protein Ta2A_11450 [Treponemataceae bacterium]